MMKLKLHCRQCHNIKEIEITPESFETQQLVKCNCGYNQYYRFYIKAEPTWSYEIIGKKDKEND